MADAKIPVWESSHRAERPSVAASLARRGAVNFEISTCRSSTRPIRRAEPADPHPELAEAIERGEDEPVIGGEAMNPRLHIAVHEVIANQLWDDDPPEVWQTAPRLLAAGHQRHDILHALGGVAAEEMWRITHDRVPFDRKRYVRGLRKLS